MLRELKKLSRQTLIYGAGVILSRAIGFFLIPLYTHYLAPRDYGVLELIDLTGYILGYVLSMGIDQAAIRYFHYYDDPADKAAVINTAIWFTLLWGALLVAILVPLTPTLSIAIFGNREYAPLLLITWANLLVGSLVGLQRSILRAQQRSVTFTAVSLAYTGVSISLNVFFVAVLHIGVRGIIYSGLISSILIASYLWVKPASPIKMRIDRAKLGPMLRYGAPFVPGGMFAFVLNWSDRYFLRLYSSIEAVGIYGLGYKFGMIVVMLVSVPFTFVWNAYLFEIEKQPNARQTYARVATYFILGLCGVGLAISVFARELIEIMADHAYWSAQQVIPVVVLAMILMCSDNVFQVGLLIRGRTGQLSVAKGVAAVVNLLLNLLLIPHYGVMGAAWATAIAFAVYAASIFYAAQRAYLVPFESARLVKVVLCSLVTFAAVQFVPAGPLGLTILNKALVVLLFPAGLLALGFLTIEERNFMLTRIRRLVAGSQGPRNDR
jgi:O-antigen/teichoic acid export membrane protein